MNDKLNPKINYNSFIFSILEYPEQEGTTPQLKIEIEGLLNNKNVRMEQRIYYEDLNSNIPWKDIKIKDMLFAIINDALKNDIIKYER